MKAIARMLVAFAVTFAMLWGWLDHAFSAFLWTVGLAVIVYLCYVLMDRLIEYLWGGR